MARQYRNSRFIYCARLGNKHISFANDEEGVTNAGGDDAKATWIGPSRPKEEENILLSNAQILIQASCIKDSTLTLLQSTIE